MLRIARQARSRRRPEIRLRRREYDEGYYLRYRDRLKAAARARLALGRRGRSLQPTSNDFRLIKPGEMMPADAGLTTRNSFGCGKADRFILEGKSEGGSWECLTADPELSAFLGFGPPGYNPDLKEFVRTQLLILYPERYRASEDLPTEIDVCNRPGWDARERGRHILVAERTGATPDFVCSHCDYIGAMIPRAEGPVKAKDATDSPSTLGAGPDDLVPAVYCPRCNVLLLLPAGTDLRQPLTASEDLLRCECGFVGRPSFDLRTAEYLCPKCALVVGATVDDRAPRGWSAKENRIA